MKKIIIFFLLMIVFAGGVLAYDNSDTGWKITNYNARVNITEDRKTYIEETIDVDFGNLEKHGIYRWVPLHYSRNGNSYNVRIKIDGVTDKDNHDLNYVTDESSGKIRLQIGDKDTLVTGKQTYKINYELERVINSFSDHDELYWNVTGEDWPVPIEKTEVSVTWPENAQIWKNICFVGYASSAVEDCNISSDKNNVTFSTKQSLSPGKGFTIASGINTGLLKQYSIWTTLGWFFADNWAYLIPIIVLILLLKNYYQKGKDPKGKVTIVPEFSPPDKLRPAVLGTLYDERVDTHDISAVVIDLAVNGYLKIKEVKQKKVIGTKTDYIITDTKKTRTGLAKYEKEIMDGIFEDGDEVKLSDLKESFYKHVSKVKEDLYQTVKEKGYFEENPEKVRNKYLIIGIILIVLFPFIVPMFITINLGASLPFIVAFVMSGLLFIIFAFLMPKRTENGVEITRQIKGFKLYMHTAERYRQKFYEDNKIFEKYLPYAMVFGIVKEWSNKFRDMQIDRPTWYEGNGAFYPWIFADSISHMQNDMNATMVAPSQAGSGGSGFSGGGVGGGFGGGGGGSW